MKKLHIVIDGTWLFRTCCPDQILSNRTITPSSAFKIDFGKFSNSLLQYVKTIDPSCTDFGDRYISTCIFRLPDNFSTWPTDNHDITSEDLLKMERNIISRKGFLENAVSAGFSRRAVYEPELKAYILRKIKKKIYSEKQVDTSVVALLVKSAITNSDDFHAIITGDADIIPAIKVAYPEYSRNVFIVTTHPDELRAEYRQSAWSLTDFDFSIPPYYFQDHVSEIISGNNVYTCPNCNKLFVQSDPLPSRSRSYCRRCRSTRT